MGHTTDFVGHLDISPPLNAAEISYLDALGAMRHVDRGGSPYDVPFNPRAPYDGDGQLPVGPGKPGLHCEWVACGDGCCLTFSGIEKFYRSEEWLRWIIDHLLAPGAQAASAGHHQLRGFTFDHRLDGVIVGSRRDNRELFALVVEDGAVDRVVISPGDPECVGQEPLAYQSAIDRDRRRLHGRELDSPAARARGVAARVRVRNRS